VRKDFYVFYHCIYFHTRLQFRHLISHVQSDLKMAVIFENKNSNKNITVFSYINIIMILCSKIKYRRVYYIENPR